MTHGRRWLALDADLFGKRFTDDLYSEFGWAGVVVWVAYLCACKRSATPGRITFLNDVQAAHELGIDGWELVDNDGKTWELSDFWTFTGRKKQTRRTPNGRRMDVTSTHWERWQETYARAREAERKSTSRGKKSRTQPGHAPDNRRTNVRPDSDSDSDIPPTPQRGGELTSSSNGQVNTEDLVDLTTAIGDLKAALRGNDG